MKNFLAVIATILGILVSIITITKFVHPEVNIEPTPEPKPSRGDTHHDSEGFLIIESNAISEGDMIDEPRILTVLEGYRIGESIGDLPHHFTSVKGDTETYFIDAEELKSDGQVELQKIMAEGARVEIVALWRPLGSGERYIYKIRRSGR